MKNKGFNSHGLVKGSNIIRGCQSGSEILVTTQGIIVKMWSVEFAWRGRMFAGDVNVLQKLCKVLSADELHMVRVRLNSL